MIRRGHSAALALPVIVIATAAFAAPANAAPTRAEYVAQVDPICQAGQAQELAAQRQTKTKLRRLKKHERAGTRKARRRAFKREERAVAHFYDFVALVEQGVNDQVAKVQPATEDTSLVQVWLRVRGEKVVATQRLARAFAKGDPLSALLLFFDAAGKSEEASDISRDLGFQYCSAPVHEVGF